MAFVYKNLFSFFLFLLMLVSFVSCETKEYAAPKRVPLGTFESDLSESFNFTGIDSVSHVNDLGATLNWTDAEGVKQYKIFETTGGAMRLVATANSPASSFVLTDLQSGTSYRFKIVAQLLSGRVMDNDNEHTFTTLTVPAAPTQLFRLTPIFSHLIGAIKKPRYFASGLRVGDTIKLYQDACATEVASLNVNSTSMQIDSTAPLTPGTYTFYTKVINKNGVASSCKAAFNSYTYQLCPEGYIEVPGNSDIGTSRFCAMAYEAKAWSDSNGDGIVSSSLEVDSDGCQESNCSTKNWGTSSYLPGSGAYGKPWRMLNQLKAKEQCQKLGENYDLISNREWMTLARNIEAKAANWSSDTLGVGCINRGNVGTEDACSYDNNITEIESDNGILASAKHILSNGAEIYHLSGNVFEWIDMGEEKLLTTAPLTCDANWTQIETADNYCDSELSGSEFMHKNSGSVSFTTYENVYDIAEDSNGYLYLATDGGLAISKDEGRSFKNYSTLNGLAKNDLSGGIALNSTDHIFVATSLGLNVSFNAGTTFLLKTTADGLLSNNIKDVFVDAVNDYVYVATTAGISISVDGGNAFTIHFNNGSGLADDSTLSVYANGAEIYVGTIAGLSYSPNSGGVFVSYTTANNLGSNRVQAVSVSGTNIYVGTSAGLTISTDARTTFTNYTTLNGLGSNAVNDIHIATNTTPETIYVATAIGMGISTDGGTSFENRLTTHGLGDNAANAVFKSTQSDILVATNKGLGISADGGGLFLNVDSSQGMGGETSVGYGQIAGGSGGAAYRGGSYVFGNYAGIYTLNFSAFPEQAFADGGFRCVFRP